VSVISSAAFALALTAAPASWAQEEPEWSELRVNMEINGTDGDAGFQIFLDGDDWGSATVRNPSGKKIYEVRAGGSALAQGLTENFVESAEPSCVDDPLDAFLERWPEGEYDFTGRSTDNEPFDDVAVFTHFIPAIPENLMFHSGTREISWTWPSAANELGNCPFPGDADPGLEPTTLVLENELFGFQVILMPDFDPLVEFIIEVDASQRRVTVPPEFTLETGEIYKYEVLVIGAGADTEADFPLDPEDLDDELRGNQTIAESTFTAP